MLLLLDRNKAGSMPSLTLTFCCRPNYSSPYAPPDTNVTTTTYSNVYIYSATMLWLAYGLAIGVSLISIIVGFVSVTANKGSYSDNFSTVLRVAHNAWVSEPLQLEDATGKEPIPEHVGKIVISWPGDGAEVVEQGLEGGHSPFQMSPETKLVNLIVFRGQLNAGALSFLHQHVTQRPWKPMHADFRTP
jgi:hypothetical protein